MFALASGSNVTKVPPFHAGNIVLAGGTTQFRTSCGDFFFFLFFASAARKMSFCFILFYYSLTHRLPVVVIFAFVTSLFSPADIVDRLTFELQQLADSTTSLKIIGMVDRGSRSVRRRRRCAVVVRLCCRSRERGLSGGMGDQARLVGCSAQTSFYLSNPIHSLPPFLFPT